MSSEAFVTLATNDGYALGAVVLAESIRQVGTKRNLVILISNHLSDLIRKTLERIFDEVIIVDELNSNDDEHLKLLLRPELGITFTKINCWLLEQYSKCVFLDADCVVLRSIENLFEREEFSAAPDAGWPDCFNSGVFVYRPSKQTFNKLMLFASQQNASFDGGDQGLLNGFFSNWRTEDISRHLPFTYNVTANAFYSYLPAVTRFRNDIHVIHFAGALKPWQLSYNPQNEQLSGNLGGQSDIQRDFLLSWWRIMHQRVWPIINEINQQSNTNNNSVNQQDEYGHSLNDSLNYGTLTENKGIEIGSAAHRRAWESGQIDYFGRDSFSNIQQQLEKSILLNSSDYHPIQQRQITPEQQTTTTSILTNSTKQSSPPLQQTTNGYDNLSKQSTTTNLGQNSITSLPQKQQPTTIHVSQNISEQPTTNILKSSIPSLQRENLQILNHSNENKDSSTEHESNWSVKSTITTTYTQGVGDLAEPTVISKVVTESLATSSHNTQVKTTTKSITDTTNSSDLNVTENGSTVRNVTSSINNEKRVNK